MGTSVVLKVFKIARAIGECNLESFQNITRANKSRNAEQFMRFFLLYSQQNYSLRLRCTLQTLFNGFQNARKFYLNRNYNNCDRQTKPKVVFLVFQK